MTGERRTDGIYGLLGRNIDYSLSPLMHNAAFEYHQIPAEYRLFDIPDDELGDFLIQAVKGGNISGLNVTVPYKMKVRPVLENDPDIEVITDDWIDLLGAVNTVKIEGNRVRLSNTDTQGFIRSLRTDTGYDVSKADEIFIAGAGGAGRAISLYLAMVSRGVRINVYDIDDEKLLSLKETFDANLDVLGSNELNLISPDGDMEKVVRGCSLVVNATPLGVRPDDRTPVPVEALPEDAAVYDLVYARRTELVRRARERGLKATGGLGMLVAQGALTFTIWTGADTEETRNVMMHEVKEKMGIE
jgi:shikimate dehydrogenase